MLQEQKSVEEEFTLFTDNERFLHVQGTTLRDANELLIGALVVLYDVTQIKRLENVRRDFVANVSHELKTPITSIKGYVETLLDGAMHEPEDAERFLRIVANQSDRLNAIIDDLLALSRVEQKAERAEIPLEMGAIQPVLRNAIEVSAAKATECGVQIDLSCDRQLQACINAPLLEQAVANLIHNACKHSPAGSTVWVDAQQQEETVVIRVRDKGCGIEAHHIPRLFERFYRVDKSRSRKLGGTGLGLAIVKHIMQAHQGQVWVESTPNQGSTFSICVPMNPVEPGTRATEGPPCCEVRKVVCMSAHMQREIERLKRQLLGLSAVVEQRLHEAVHSLHLAMDSWLVTSSRVMPRSTTPKSKWRKNA